MVVFVISVLIICFKFPFVHSLGPRATLSCMDATRTVAVEVNPENTCSHKIAHISSIKEDKSNLLKV